MSIYDTLNEQQKKGVFTTDGPVLLLAGAGSGKTRVMVHRIAYLIEEMGVNPFNILAITFTNKAAGEMRSRVDKLIGFGSEQIWVSTFHSMCVKILRRFADKIGYDTNFVIYDTDDSKAIVKEIIKKLNIDTRYIKEKTIRGAISRAKDELIGVEQFEKDAAYDMNERKIAAAYREYQTTLKKNNAMDFDDLIYNTVKLFKEHPQVLLNYQERFQYIHVDEYQDTNTAQFELVRLLADKNRNLCVVGDDDQSIYKFRGANIRNILEFEKEYKDATVIKLEENYRSTQNILDAANAVIHNNVRRKDKSLWTRKDSGSQVHFRQFETGKEEAEFIVSDIKSKARKGIIGYSGCAVLYRTNAQARLIEESCIMAGVPYQVVGGVNFYSRKEIKDLMAYLKTIDNGKDDLAVKRIINIPKRGIGATTILKAQEAADAENISFYDALKKARSIPSLAKSADKIERFTDLIEYFRHRLEEYTLVDLMDEIIAKTGYVESLNEDGDDTALDRIGNIDELITKINTFTDENDEATLSDFLAEVALVTDLDETDDDVEKLLLMTLHAAKGLEFPHVYIAGMEDGIFPGMMSIVADERDELEEERRLCYVGMTRAMQDLTLCCAKCRMQRGEIQYNAVSRFVKEIPMELLDNKPQVRRTRDFDDYGEDNVFASSFKPKAIARAKQTERMPQMAKEVKALNQISGLAKGSDMNLGDLDYTVGDRVHHIKFGDGTVTKIDREPRDYKVTVDFDTAGTRIMYAIFSKLKKI
ncbi:MAG: UvrD-helicase domain-containing protein [Lachnospiraceae bacterium]|nr:UvrD-helicase domain-containing protein [Lachnospiraceae bacterium]MBP5298701.1 UvrD-helicase domain-containing protein [Lachnospiraceae bacterium]